MESTKQTSKNDRWVKIASKSHPGRYYLFNRSTGETKWLTVLNNIPKNVCETATVKNKGKHLKRLQHTPKKVSTPAQDRLRNLQRRLQSTDTKRDETRALAEEASNVIDHEPPRTPEQENCSETTADAPATTTSPVAQKRKYSESSTAESPERSCNEIPTKRSTLSVHINTNTNADTDSDTVNASVSASASASVKPKTDSSNEGIRIVKTNTTTTALPEKIKTDKEPEENARGLSIFEKLKSLYNKLRSLSSSSKDTNENDWSNDELTDMCTKAVVVERKVSIPEISNDLAFVRENLHSIRTSGICKRRPRKVGSANSRLDALRKSLAMQRMNDTGNVSETESSTSLLINDNSDISLDDSNCNGGVQPMDWQPIDSRLEMTASESSLSSTATFGLTYDAVSNNLRRLMCERQSQISDNKCDKWRTDHYYFIIDTNIFILDLAFLENLCKMIFAGTEGSILYVPYCVLQELDQLKGKTWDRRVKTLAIHAIKFLNNKLEKKSQYVQAQSAIEENQQLIDIVSEDDSIINCCLQVKQHICNVMLLSEDTNLRNKAICNNIAVSTKNDLLAKHKCQKITTTP